MAFRISSKYSKKSIHLRVKDLALNLGLSILLCDVGIIPGLLGPGTWRFLRSLLALKFYDSVVLLGRQRLIIRVVWPLRGRINLQGQQAYRAQEMPLCDPYLVQRQVVEPGGGEVCSQPQDWGKGDLTQLPLFLMD